MKDTYDQRWPCSAGAIARFSVPGTSNLAVRLFGHTRVIFSRRSDPATPQPSRAHRLPVLFAVIGCSIATVAIGGGAGWWWWKNAEGVGHSQSSPAASSGSSPAAAVTLLVSGDTAGWIVPCGCTTNQSGGLARRGSFVAACRQQGPVIVADAGGAPGGTSAYQRARFEAILDGELAMGIAAHNLGEQEVLLGSAYLRNLASEKHVPFVSANVRDREHRLVAEPFRIVDSGGIRVALIGVVEMRGTVSGSVELQIDNPRDAVLDAIAQAAGKFDRAVVLAHVREDELRELALALPEVDAVIGGPTGQSLAPVRVGQVLVASATNKGKFLVSLSLSAKGKRLPAAAEIVEMSDQFADEAQQVENVRSFRRELGRRDFNASETGLVPPVSDKAPPGYKIAGTAACRECHADEYAAWSDSQHAHAWQTLADERVEVDPFCQMCHTTGYGLPGGFQSLAKSEARVAVGCESCHGPSQAHVERPRQRTAFTAREQCARCHDQENSPRFEFATYWKQIRHGPIAKEQIEN